MMAKRAEVDNDEDLYAIIENPVSNVCGNGFPDTDHDLKSTNGNKSSSKVRVPVQYHSINATSLSASSSWTDPADNNVDALVSRYKYYSRLDAHRDSSLRMPDHVVPPSFMITILIPTRGGKQSSLVTIFALWNTMMGTSLLSMPWAIRQAGFITGILLLLAMSGLMLYTSYRIMNSARSIGEDSAIVEFSDVCRFYLGRWADICSTVFSLATLLGGAIVYWILMTNFLYNTVAFIYDKVSNSSVMFPSINSSANYDAICPAITGGYIHMTNITVYNQESHHWIIEVFQDTGRSVFEQVWDLQKTVPFFLLIILTPLINFKSPTFFTKFNSLGTLCVFFLLGFVIAKAAKWGINMDWNPADSGDDYYVHAFKPTFPALTGIASLAFFIHNAVLSVMRNQKHPENNARDLTLAYCLVTLTYLIVGVTFYMTFPDAKNCIEDLEACALAECCVGRSVFTVCQISPTYWQNHQFCWCILWFCLRSCIAMYGAYYVTESKRNTYQTELSYTCSNHFIWISKFHRPVRFAWHWTIIFTFIVIPGKSDAIKIFSLHITKNASFHR